MLCLDMIGGALGLRSASLGVRELKRSALRARMLLPRVPLCAVYTPARARSLMQHAGGFAWETAGVEALFGIKCVA